MDDKDTGLEDSPCQHIPPVEPARDTRTVSGCTNLNDLQFIASLLLYIPLLTLQSPVVTHVRVREAGGENVRTVLVTLEVAAPRGEGLRHGNQKVGISSQITFERTVFICEIESKLDDDMKPSRFGGLQGVKPFCNYYGFLTCIFYDYFNLYLVCTPSKVSTAWFSVLC